MLNVLTQVMNSDHMYYTMPYNHELNDDHIDVSDESDFSINYEIDRLLINTVRSYPHLYDRSSKDFKDAIKKTNSWNEISNILQRPAEECQRRWIRLRERFSRERRFRGLHGKSDGEISTRKPFSLYNSMLFINRFVKSRKTYTNMTPPLIKSCDDESSVEPGEINKDEIQEDSLAWSSNCNLKVTNSMVRNMPRLILPAPVSDIPTDSSSSQRNNEKIKSNDPTANSFEKSLLQISTYVCNKLSAENETSELLFGRLVAHELMKLDEASRTKKKRKIMEILWE